MTRHKLSGRASAQKGGYSKKGKGFFLEPAQDTFMAFCVYALHFLFDHHQHDEDEQGVIHQVAQSRERQSATEVEQQTQFSCSLGFLF